MIVDGAVGILLQPLMIGLAIERQRVEAMPTLDVVEPAPRQEEAHRVNPVIQANVRNDVEIDALYPYRISQPVSKTWRPRFI